MKEVSYIESDCCLRLVPSKSTHARDKANEYLPSCTSFIQYEIGPEIDSARLLTLRNKVCCYQLSSLHINVRYRTHTFRIFCKHRRAHFIIVLLLGCYVGSLSK